MADNLTFYSGGLIVPEWSTTPPKASEFPSNGQTWGVLTKRVTATAENPLTFASTDSYFLFDAPEDPYYCAVAAGFVIHNAADTLEYMYFSDDGGNTFADVDPRVTPGMTGWRPPQYGEQLQFTGKNPCKVNWDGSGVETSLDATFFVVVVNADSPVKTTSDMIADPYAMTSTP